MTFCPAKSLCLCVWERERESLRNESACVRMHASLQFIRPLRLPFASPLSVSHVLYLQSFIQMEMRFTSFFPHCKWQGQWQMIQLARPGYLSHTTVCWCLSGNILKSQFSQWIKFIQTFVLQEGKFPRGFKLEGNTTLKAIIQRVHCKKSDTKLFTICIFSISVLFELQHFLPNTVIWLVTVRKMLQIHPVKSRSRCERFNYE